jgi:hypothetical protein
MKDLQGSLSNRYIYNPKGLPCYTRLSAAALMQAAMREGPGAFQPFDGPQRQILHGLRTRCILPPMDCGWTRHAHSLPSVRFFFG